MTLLYRPWLGASEPPKRYSLSTRSRSATAHVYGTERNVGAMLSQQLLAGEISRDDVFVTTKVARARPDVKLILTPPCIYFIGDSPYKICRRRVKK